MAVGILKYNLDDSEDRMAFERANKSLDMGLALWEIHHNLRRIVENKQQDKYDYETLDCTMECINDILNQYGINLDTLIE